VSCRISGNLMRKLYPIFGASDITLKGLGYGP
jgi:hypothetical protein